MKKKELSLKHMQNLASSMTGEKIVGFLGGVPVIAKKQVPKGEIWVLNENEWNMPTKLAKSI